MSREDEFKAILSADPEFVSLMVGGIYTDQEVGVEGIIRGDHSPTGAAFDENGLLLLTCVIREGPVNPYQNIYLLRDKIMTTSQLVYINFYERRGHEGIDLARNRAYTLLMGYSGLQDAYAIWLAYETSAFPDMGPVKNSTLLRQDWQVITLRKPNV